MLRIVVLVLLSFGLSQAALGQKSEKADAQAANCEKVAKLALPNATVTSAEVVAAGAFRPNSSVTPWMAQAESLYKSLPPFCRVRVESHPSSDSDIKIEVWLPLQGWNGKLQGRGNGGFAGEIDDFTLALAVHEGYATVATDTGHAASGTDARWALGHPEKVTDFGYRAIHEMTQDAKLVVKQFYGKHPLQHAYFASCSNGGRQALMEAQRFPGDYDGIIAGAPANYWTHLVTSAIWQMQATMMDSASYIPPAKLPAIAKAVDAACDAQDGTSDGIVDEPRKCHFDPAAILCKAEDSKECLTSAQVTALKKIYAGPSDASGTQIYPGLLPGAEDGSGGWGLWITGSEPGKSLMQAFGTGFFSNMVFEKPDWNFRDANISDIVKAADVKLAKTLNATDPNLSAFKARGGKLILYHGWNDPAISAVNTVNYYQRVVGAMGQDGFDSFARVYMVPGMQHCEGGVGPDSFGENGPWPTLTDPHQSLQLSIEQWLEKGTAPKEIVATKFSGPLSSGQAQMTRTLCAYPKVAKYKGNGDENDASNFVCEDERK
ncbi:MAG TPA: tannase/feruloyl esterase family alpha/beta hydrolase [Candidatus Sulfotelmatobacter sp.]|nr:tannase/feruloyl esterase family alpha/beta hydrolase [Candidatus Sulfotelmatobacter sp.]